MLTRISSTGLSNVINNWVWGIFAHATPVATHHARIDILAGDQATVLASWAFPQDIPAKIMFTNPIKLDNNYIQGVDVEGFTYQFSYLVSPSPQYDK